MVCFSFRSLVAWATFGIASLASAIDWNFESGRLDGWTQSGTAFANQPTLGNNIRARGRDERFTLQGRYFIGTYENHPSDSFEAGLSQGDGPTGTLTSDLITLTGTRFSCLLGGGMDRDREAVVVFIKATAANRARFETEPRDPETGRVVPYRRTSLADGDYYEVLRETGRKEEAMRRVSTTFYAQPGDQARVKIYDLSAGPWGHINVDDIQFSSAPGGSLASRIHVTDDERANVAGADVYVNGARIGATDANGMVNAGVLRPNDKIVARKLIEEVATYRSGHSTGSRQNWKYRIYKTSLVIGNDGSAVPVSASGDSARTEEVRVSRGNVVIGLNVNVSVEWDTSAAELAVIRRDLQRASAYFYNASDGQFLFEQIDLKTDARGWQDADFRVHADTDLRPHTDIPFGWFDPGLLAPGLMHMARTTNNWGGGAVYVHEFGHYGMGLFDEYLDLLPVVRCTYGMDSATGPFAPNGPKAACLMYTQFTGNKFCSTHRDNPHIVPTLQGILHAHDCWTSILDTYGPRRNDLTNRFILKSPVTRGAIPGTLPAMPRGWEPKINESASNHGEFRGAMTLTVTDGSQPLEGVTVWLHTQEGRDIKQGKTNTAGVLVVVGCHNGDFVRYDGREQRVRVGRGLLASRTSVFVPQGQATMAVTLPANGSKLLIGTKQGTMGANVYVRLQGGKLDDTPAIFVTNGPGAKPVELKAMRGFAPDGYSAILPPDTLAGAIVTVEGREGGVKLVGNAAISFLTATEEHLDLFSPDGAVAFRLPAGALPKGTKAAVGPSAEIVAASEGRVVAGPFAASATAAPAGKEKMVVSFRLDPKRKVSDPKAFRILFHDGVKWVEVPGLVYGAELGTVAAPVDRFGDYVLVTR